VVPAGQKKFQKILIAIDKSGYKDKIVEYAFDLAKAEDAEIIAIHVIDKASLGAVGDLLGYYRGGKIEAYQEEMKTQGSKLLDNVRMSADSLGVRITTEVIVGQSVAESIIDYAREHDVSLIIVGTKGMTGVQKFLLGSVANNVITNAHCPVLAIR
jgi:nucleotide-binding universal stress UspA family protein